MTLSHVSSPSRFEHIPFSVFTGSVDASQALAREVATLVKKGRPDGSKVVLGLATGSTPLNFYAELIRILKTHPFRPLLGRPPTPARVKIW